MMRLSKIPSILCLLIANILFLSCATVSSEKDPRIEAPLPEYATFEGVPRRVQIVRFEIPSDIVSRYPELAEKRVGFGLYNRLIDEFSESGRFSFIEEKDEMIGRVVAQWELSDSGLVSEETAIKSGGVDAPEYLAYAEIFEFSVGTDEKIAGIRSEKATRTVIGVQIRLVDVGSGTYIPASGLAEAVSRSEGVWAPSLPFDQTTVGVATRKAVRSAVLSLTAKIK